MMPTEPLLLEVTVDSETADEYRAGRIGQSTVVELASEVRDVPAKPREEVLAEATEAILGASAQFAMPDETWDAYAADLATRLRAMGEGPTGADYEAVMEGSLLRWDLEPAPIVDVIRDIRQRAAELARERSNP